ncbi:MAG: 16S rRNA (uracil(1498)-N(3))-methyltransferase [Planctomycetaceae bacterium]|nr:16S rRNA (uracil(1498)-N(3))-methyltransferase [Planctomycetaceae bacterium]
MADRFYAPVSFDAPVVELSREESQHLGSVLRKSPGDVVEIFDGTGRAAEAVVESVGKRAVTVRILRPLRCEAASVVGIELATAVPKGDRASWLIEKATELGADMWTPLRLTRSVVEPGEGKLGKLRQTVVTACKQCGRNRLMEIQATHSWLEWLPAAAARGAVIVADPSGASPREALATLVAGPTRDSVAIAIGPEGGFAEIEVAAARSAGALVVNLGPNILRIETAALAALAWLRLGMKTE